MEDSETQRSNFAEGKKMGARLVKKSPDDAEMHLLYASNLGRWGEVYGIMQSARKGVAGTLRDLAKRTIQLAPELNGAGGHLLLAQVHYKAPYIPFVLSRPSTEKP